MKKYFILFLTFLIVFSLAGCHSEELNELSMSVIENNKKVDNVITKYDKNREIITSFDLLFISNITSFDGVDETINRYCPNTSITDSMVEVQNSISERYISIETSEEDKVLFFKNLSSSIETFPLMEDTTGNVEEIILIRDIGLYFTFYWEDGVIVRYDYSFMS